MDKINDLLTMFKHDSLGEKGMSTLINLMFKELKNRATTAEFLGEQVMTVKADNALLKQKLLNKRVS